MRPLPASRAARRSFIAYENAGFTVIRHCSVSHRPVRNMPNRVAVRFRILCICLHDRRMGYAIDSVTDKKGIFVCASTSPTKFAARHDTSLRMRHAAPPGRVEIRAIHVDNDSIPAAQRSPRRCCPVFRLPEVVVVAYPVHVLMPRLRARFVAGFAARFVAQFAARLPLSLPLSLPLTLLHGSLLVMPHVILPPVLSACLAIVTVDRSRCLSLRPGRLFAAGKFARRI
jgi:hypothetical protein